MMTTCRITAEDDAPVYTVRDALGVLRGLIRHRWGLWTFEPHPYDILAASTTLDRLTARLPRLLEGSA